MKHKLYGFAVCIGLLLSESAYSAVCLTPGEFKNNFLFETQVLNDSLIKKARTIKLPFFGTKTFPAEDVQNPGNLGQSLVDFQGTNNIRLDASASRPIGIVGVTRQIEAFARGKMYVDFIIDCGNTTGETITASVFFRVKRVGRITTLAPGSTSKVQVLARFRDNVTNRDVDSRLIENKSVGGLLGKTIKVLKIPVPIPDIQETEEATIETFVLQLRKGREYRFELIAAAKSTAGLAGSVTFATANFRDPIVDIGINDTPGIALVNFEMDIATDQGEEISELKMIVESLREALVLLTTQIEDLDPSVGEQISNLQSIVDEQEEAIAILQDDQAQFDSTFSDIQQQLSGINDQLTILQQENVTQDGDIWILQDGQAQLNSDISDIQQQLSSFNDQISLLEQSNALQNSNILILQNDQTQLNSEISVIKQQLTNFSDLIIGLQTQIDELRNYTENHTHEYLTGKGQGHNNTNANTSPPM